MSLRIRRGLESDRITKTLESGELGYATDTYRLYVGDGVTSGGRNVLATVATDWREKPWMSRSD